MRGRVCACACGCSCACVRVWFTTHMHVGLANVDRALYSIHYRFSFDVGIFVCALVIVCHFISKFLYFCSNFGIGIQVSGMRINLQLRIHVSVSCVNLFYFICVIGEYYVVKSGLCFLSRLTSFLIFSSFGQIFPLMFLWLCMHGCINVGLGFTTNWCLYTADNY